MLRILTLCLAALAAPLAAQDYPALFDVSGVASDDVLNIRENPRGSAGRVGELAWDAKAVEVVATSDSGDWGLVNTGEQSGWVSMRYLVATEGAATGRFDAPLSCFGTEPFWSITFDGAGASTFDLQGEDSLSGKVTHALLSRGGGGAQAARSDIEADILQTVVVTPGACSDGMSDRMYGLNAALIHEAGGAKTLFSGCCSIAPN